MTQYQILRQGINDNREDWDRRLILADYLEETGELKEAEFWRWTAKNKKRAHLYCKNFIYYLSPSKIYNSGIDPFSDIDITGFFIDEFSLSYKTNQKADDALMKAWMNK